MRIIQTMYDAVTFKGWLHIFWKKNRFGLLDIKIMGISTKIESLRSFHFQSIMKYADTYDYRVAE